VERHVGGERGFAHARAAGQDDEVGGLQTAEQAVDVGEAGDEAGDAAAARLRLFGEFDGAAQAFGEVDRAAAVFGAFADAIERLLGLSICALGGLSCGAS